MGRAGFEPTKPKQLSYSQSHLATLESPQTFLKEPPEGFEPTTPRLQITCSGQLSYGGNLKYLKNFYLIRDYLSPRLRLQI